MDTNILNLPLLNAQDCIELTNLKREEIIKECIGNIGTRLRNVCNCGHVVLSIYDIVDELGLETIDNMEDSDFIWLFEALIKYYEKQGFKTNRSRDCDLELSWRYDKSDKSDEQDLTDKSE